MSSTEIPPVHPEPVFLQGMSLRSLKLVVAEGGNSQGLERLPAGHDPRATAWNGRAEQGREPAMSSDKRSAVRQPGGGGFSACWILRKPSPAARNCPQTIRRETTHPSFHFSAGSCRWPTACTSSSIACYSPTRTGDSSMESNFFWEDCGRGQQRVKVIE